MGRAISLLASALEAKGYFVVVFGEAKAHATIFHDVWMMRWTTAEHENEEHMVISNLEGKSFVPEYLPPPDRS